MSLTKVSYSMIDTAPVNVVDYGADPTGSNDSTAAINAAFAASTNIYIPAGTYLISGTGLQYVTSYQHITTITGAGANNTTFSYSGSGTLLKSNTRGGVYLRGIKLLRNGNRDSTIGLNFDANEYSIVEQCQFIGFSKGLVSGIGTGGDSFFNKIDSCFFDACDFDVYFSVTPAGNLPSNSNTFINCKFSNTTQWGVYHDGGIKNTFIGCAFEGVGDGLYLRGNDCAVINCYVENSGGTGIEVDAGYGPGGNDQSGYYNAIINPINAGGAGAFVDNGINTFFVGRDGLQTEDLLLQTNVIGNKDGASAIILQRARTAENLLVVPGGYPLFPNYGLGINAGGYNDTTSKACVSHVGGVGDNNKRCGWVSYGIKTNGVNDGSQYYIRPLTYDGSGFVEQTSNGVYLADNATSWASASDERLKTNLLPIDNALNKVLQLRTVTGKYITDDIKTSRVFLIAQDVQKVLPEAVSENNEGYLGLSYTDVIPLMVAAIKELTAKVEDLQTKMEAK